MMNASLLRYLSMKGGESPWWVRDESHFGRGMVRPLQVYKKIFQIMTSSIYAANNIRGVLNAMERFALIALSSKSITLEESIAKGCPPPWAEASAGVWPTVVPIFLDNENIMESVFLES